MVQTFFCFGIIGLWALGSASTTFAQTSKDGAPANASSAQLPDTVDKDYAAELPRVPPLSLEDAAKSLQVADGFAVELIAAEPLVYDPIAFAFDARYRLFVVEMRDYSEQETEHLGSIALLEDTDADGKLDRRSVFVDGLSWPTAIWPWKDGVLVAEPPRITFYRDTDGDGRSDEAQDWFVGFGRGNVQGLVNSLRWGIDGFLHGATSSSGAEIATANGADAMLALGRRDFAIDTLRQTMAAEAGGGQHGMSFNRWGDKFVTSNSDHLQQVADIDWWLAEHSSDVAFPSTRRSIALDGPQAEVYRVSPVEPWRVVRTRLRMSGVAPGVVEGGGRAAGYFTGATGTCIMDREAGFGDLQYDTAIVCDVGSNLVHRKKITDNQLFWSGERIDEASELLRSSDIWFRPVQIGDGPDGALYIADMAREVIEHPKSLPPMIKKHLDLTSGRDRGRFWRLAPEGLQPSLPPAPATLASKELVNRLADSIAWQRRMASQLLVEREATDVASELRQTARDSANPEAQVLALNVLSRLGLFTADIATSLLSSEHERVLQHVIRLSTRNRIALDLAKLTADVRPRIQLEVAMASMDTNISKQTREQWLANLFGNADEPLVYAALATAAGRSSWQLFERASSRLDEKHRNAWIQLLMPVWTKQLDTDPELKRGIVNKMTMSGEEAIAWRVAVCRFTARADIARVLAALTEKQATNLDRDIELALEDALDNSAEKDMFHLIRLASPTVRQVFAEQLLQPTRSEAAQRAVLSLIAWGETSLADLVIQKFSTLSPALQADALRGLASRTNTATLLSNAIEQKVVAIGLIPVEIRDQLRTSSDKGLAQKFEQLFGSVSSDRQALVEQYSEAISLASLDVNLLTGKEVFRTICGQCHRLGDIGNDVGPPLRQLSEKSPQQLLETILDPNREIDPKYTSYSLLTGDGQVLTGIIQDESPGQVVLRSAGGISNTVSRAEIVQMKSSGNSLMPVGLEASISPEQMFQLIQFLKSTASN